MTDNDRSQDPTTRGFAYGPEEGATYGPEHGSTYGPQRAERYRIRLTATNGRRTTIGATLGVDLVLEHSSASDLSVEVPRLDGLADFRLGDFELFYGDVKLFRATLEKFPGPGIGERATLYGRGPGRELTRGAINVSFSSREAYDAISEVWREYTRFDATVIRPTTPTTLSDFSAEGTPMEVLQDLHEQAGMRFTILHQQSGKRVESYIPEENVKSGDWTAIEHASDGDMTDYANSVEVYGGEKSGGGRAFARAEDTAEIDRVGEEGPIRIDDSSLTTDADCQARAETELNDRVDTDTLSGSLEITPQLVLPGYIYTIPEWERSDGVVPELTLSRTKYQESPGDATASLEVNAGEGVEDVLTVVRRETARLNQP